MLPVGVHLNNGLVAKVPRNLKPSLYCASYSKIERQISDFHPEIPGNNGRSICRSVVDNEDVYVGFGGSDFVDNVPNTITLIVSWDYCKNLLGSDHTRHLND